MVWKVGYEGITGARAGRIMVEEQEGQRTSGLKRTPLRERSRQWFLTAGTILALLATTI